MKTLPLVISLGGAACAPTAGDAPPASPAPRRATVVGTAGNAKAGAVVEAGDGRVVYVIGIDAWPDDVVGKRVRATGVVEYRKHIPDPVIAEDGAISQGAVGEQWVIDDADWKLGPALPACGGPEWEAMGQALAAACGASSGDAHARACRALLEAWPECSASIRPAADFRDQWQDEILVALATGGEWHGAVFARTADGWQVVGFDGGDIK